MINKAMFEPYKNKAKARLVRIEAEIAYLTPFQIIEILKEREQC